ASPATGRHDAPGHGGSAASSTLIRRRRDQFAMSGTTTRGTAALEKWVEDSARLTQPERIVWCDGSEQEYVDLVAGMLRTGELIQVNERAYPNSYLHRSNPNDVARTEEVTLICTERQEDAGPT